MAKKASFDWQDPLRLDESLSDEERAVRDAARQYAQKKLLPRVRDAFREEKPEPRLIREFGDQGLLGVPFGRFFRADRKIGNNDFGARHL